MRKHITEAAIESLAAKRAEAVQGFRNAQDEAHYERYWGILKGIDLAFSVLTGLDRAAAADMLRKRGPR